MSTEEKLRIQTIRTPFEILDLHHILLVVEGLDKYI